MSIGLLSWPGYFAPQPDEKRSGGAQALAGRADRPVGGRLPTWFGVNEANHPERHSNVKPENGIRENECDWRKVARDTAKIVEQQQLCTNHIWCDLSGGLLCLLLLLLVFHLLDRVHCNLILLVAVNGYPCDWMPVPPRPVG
eukprot:scaffold67053_cov35-Tisochrysis_lutea.AAC.2